MKVVAWSFGVSGWGVPGLKGSGCAAGQRAGVLLGCECSRDVCLWNSFG